MGADFSSFLFFNGSKNESFLKLNVEILHSNLLFLCLIVCFFGVFFQVLFKYYDIQFHPHQQYHPHRHQHCHARHYHRLILSTMIL